MAIEKYNHKWLAALTALLAILLYANTVPNSFAIDDNAVIAANPYVQQGLKGLGGIFTSDVWLGGDAEIGYYRPIPLATFALEHQLWGSNPHLSHTVNVLLYALTGWLLCLLLLKVLNRYHPLLAFGTALLFIAHPVHTEVVANIKSRDELLQFLFLLLAGWYMLQAATDNKKLLLSALFYYIALLCKETASAGLLLLPGLMYFATDSKPLSILKHAWVYVPVLLIFLVQKKLALGDGATNLQPDLVSFPYTGNMAVPAALKQLWWYCKLLVFPYPLSYNYAYNQLPVSGWADIVTLAGLVALLLGMVGIFYGYKQKKVWWLGIFIWLIALIPALGFVVLKGGILAERFLYVPVLGFCLLVMVIVFRLMGLSPEREQPVAPVKMAVPAMLLLLYGGLTVARNPDWKDDFTLAETDVLAAPNSCQVRLHYGKKLIDMGVEETDARKKEEYFYRGLEQLQRAVAINPRYARAYFKIAYAYQALQPNTDSAVYYYRRAIDEAPGYAIAYKNLGLAYLQQGKVQLAQQQLQRALQADPQLNGVQEILNSLNSPNEPAFKPVEVDTAGFEYCTSTGMQLARSQKLAEALVYFDKALALQPQSLEALVNIATCYGMLGNYAKSEFYLLQAEKIAPNNGIVLQNLKILYRNTGNKAKEQLYTQKLQTL